MQQIKELIIGGTGSGKTYHAIHRAQELGGGFIYVAPTRMLAMQVYMDYMQESDTLKSGSVSIEGSSDGNIFAVYESVGGDLDKLSKYTNVIIDEAHYLTDQERISVNNLRLLAEQVGCNVFLVTATQEFRLIKGYKQVALKGVKFKKREVSFEKSVALMQRGKKTLILASSYQDVDYWISEIGKMDISMRAMTAQMTESENLQALADFNDDTVNVLVATNIAAQGCNMWCENLIIEYNDHDTDVLLKQKLGRLGRRGMDQSKVYTWSLFDCARYTKIQHIREKISGQIRMNKTPHKHIIGEPTVICPMVEGLEIAPHEFVEMKRVDKSNLYESAKPLTYPAAKYQLRHIQAMVREDEKKSFLASWTKNEMENVVYEADKDVENLKKIIKNHQENLKK